MVLQNLKQIEDIRQSLTDDEILPSEAWDAIKELTKDFKSWQTPYWKREREKLIGDECTNCGAKASDGVVMVLQHGWKPRYNPALFGDMLTDEILDETQSQYAEIRKECYAVALEEYPLEPPTTEICPGCGYRSFSHRKTTNDYRCSRCKAEFETPAIGVAPQTKRSYEDKEAVLRRIDYRYKRNVRRIAFGMVKSSPEAQKHLYLEWIDENLSYLRFEGTKTYCKRCAFLEDMTDGVQLCPYCNTNSIRASQSICKACSYDEETGVYMLTPENAIKWYRRQNDYADFCGKLLDKGPNGMLFFRCILQRHGLRVIETADDFLKVEATQGKVYEALSERESLY